VGPSLIEALVAVGGTPATIILAGIAWYQTVELNKLRAENKTLNDRVFNLFVSAAGLEETNHG
jgi:hypothetical protein